MSACGCVMDYVTHLYYSRMRPYRDRPDIEVKGRWHWCPPGAIDLPFFHVYGSYLYDDDTMDIDYDLGEVPHQYGSVRAGENPRYIGQNWCGSRELWEQGAVYLGHQVLPVAPDGVPLCCLTTAPIIGGCAANGIAQQGSPARFAVGTVRVLGQVEADFYRPATGTLIVSGQAEADFYRPATGTLIVSGQAEADFYRPAIGTLIVSGQAEADFYRAALATLLVSGQTRSYPLVGSVGGLMVSGLSRSYRSASSVGGLVLSGSVDATYGRHSAAGGIRLGGSCAILHGPSAAGGLSLRGAAHVLNSAQGAILLGGFAQYS